MFVCVDENVTPKSFGLGCGDMLVIDKDSAVPESILPPRPLQLHPDPCPDDSLLEVQVETEQGVYWIVYKEGDSHDILQYMSQEYGAKCLVCPVDAHACDGEDGLHFHYPGKGNVRLCLSTTI